MLAVFRSSVASAPQELLSPSSSSSSSSAVGTTTTTSHGSFPTSPPPPPLNAQNLLLDAFSTSFSDVIRVSFPNGGASMAYSPSSPSHQHSRSFASLDGVFCLFEGRLDNLVSLRQDYGIAKTNGSEVSLIIHAYMALRDRGPIPPNRVVAELDGHFAFVLFDTKNQSVFVAHDSEGVTIPWFWGTTSDGSLVFSDSPDLLKHGCGKSFAPFPPGCYFTSKMGLQSYEHPSRKLKPVPRVDSKGNALGALFKVDSNHKGFIPMSRVGSEANWSQTI